MINLFSAVKLSPFSKVMLYQIASGCAHLNECEIQSAVSYVIEDDSLQKILCEEINSIKNRYGDLMLLKRHPVILILDEVLNFF